MELHRKERPGGAFINLLLSRRNQMQPAHHVPPALAATFLNILFNRVRAVASVCLLLWFTLSSTAHAEKKLIVAYVPNWIDLKAFTDRIDYDKLTHINIAFENPVNSSGEMSFNEANTGLIAKAKAHGVKVLVSIGGGAASEDKVIRDRYFHLISDANREMYVHLLSDYLAKHGLDGVDVDLEGPSINEDYAPFIEALSARLKPQGRLLTAALSQGYGGDKAPASVFAQLDFLNIMAYDGAGPWAPDKPGPHSSYEYSKASVAYWVGRGLPKAKAVLGVPFYGYGFGAAAVKHDYGYGLIVTMHPEAHNMDQTGSTIWYNGIPTMKAKARYVVDEGLAGMMIWSLDNDAPGPKSLLTAMYETLRK